MPVREMRLTWTPGPEGRPVAANLEDLVALLHSPTGRPGLNFEVGRRTPTGGLETRAVVMRDLDGQPIGVLQLKYLDGTPELVNIAVAPGHQRRGIAFAMARYLKDFGDVDLREVGAVHDGPLTDEGRAFRDKAFSRSDEIYGPIDGNPDGQAA